MLTSYISMKIRMSKVKRDGESIKKDEGFNGGTAHLYGEHDIDEIYDNSVNNISEDLEILMKMNSNVFFNEL